MSVGENQVDFRHPYSNMKAISTMKAHCDIAGFGDHLQYDAADTTGKLGFHSGQILI